MVIQRWQSLFLLLVCALMACFTFVPLGQIQTQDFTFNFNTLGLTYAGEPTDGAPSGYFLHTWYFFAVSLVSSILPLIAIFKFNNLPLQKRLCLVEILFIIAAAAIAVTIGYWQLDNSTVGWSGVAIVPVIALIADVMACNFINRDHKLLSSADRLR